MARSIRIGDSRARKILRATLLMLIGLPLLYLSGALIGAFVPRNPAWQEPKDGIIIFVRSNGVHADLVVPAKAAGFNLYRLVPPAHLGNPKTARGWIAFGWRQREFYLETPRWTDLTVRNAARAVLGGKALMHVEHVAHPRPSDASRPVRLRPEEYRRLLAAVELGFISGKDCLELR